MTTQHIQLEAQVPESMHHQRLDKVLSALFPAYSRAQHQQWIADGAVRVNDAVIQKNRHTVSMDDHIDIQAQQQDTITWQAEDLPLNIVFEDEHLLIINKPAQCIVHPGAGVTSGTLANALLHHLPELAQVARAGLIHRLDKDTTGLMVVAKTIESHHQLTKMMTERHIRRHYTALVHGDIISGGKIGTPFGRHPHNRTKMAVLQTGKRQAVTHYRIATRYRGCTQLTLQLETGRTHQIRVHMQHLRHPIIGDQTYGRAHAAKTLPEAVHRMRRQLLHAEKLSFTHPFTRANCSWTAPLPDDFEEVLAQLAEHKP